MRHHNKNKKFGRVRNQRGALLRGLTRELVLRERITTTEARAKALRPIVEKLITKGKQDTLNSHRIVSSRLGNSILSKKVVEDLASRYKKREGGYTRITKLQNRTSDRAKMAVIELVK
jgi:large subunit ribosomal protein L17